MRTAKLSEKAFGFFGGWAGQQKRLSYPTSPRGGLLFLWNRLPSVVFLSNHSPDDLNCCATGNRPQTRVSLRSTLGREPRFPLQQKREWLKAILCWSGKRGSNPPPPPWQGGALPNELFPRITLPFGNRQYYTQGERRMSSINFEKSKIYRTGEGICAKCENNT